VSEEGVKMRSPVDGSAVVGSKSGKRKIINVFN
jgi:hypothetical protein